MQWRGSCYSHGECCRGSRHDALVCRLRCDRWCNGGPSLDWRVHFALNLSLSQRLLVQTHFVNRAIQDAGYAAAILPTDPKGVDAAPEGIRVCRGCECLIQVAVDVEADRRAASHNRDVRPRVQRNLVGSANEIVRRLSPYVPAGGEPCESEVIARIQAEQILIVGGLAPLVDDRGNFGIRCGDFHPCGEGRRRSRIQGSGIGGLDVGGAPVKRKCLAEATHGRPSCSRQASRVSVAAGVGRRGAATLIKTIGSRRSGRGCGRNLEHHVYPVVRSAVRSRRICTGISVNTVRRLQGMQRNVIKSGGREVTPIGAKVPDRRAIRGCISGVRRDGHWRGKISLLPARRGFAGECDCRK